MNLKYATRCEDTEQIHVVEWAAWNERRHPELKLLHHVPNGGSRNKAEAVKLKQMGVRAGVPDLCLPVPKGIYHGLYIEMKYGEGRIEKSQREFLKAAASQGYFCVVCYGADVAVSVLQEYISLLPSGPGEKKDRMGIQNACILREGRVKKL